MTVTQSNLAERRQLHFTKLDDVIADAEMIVSKPHRTLGKWSSSQIIEHLANGMNMAFDGADFKAPWLVRTLIAPMVKNKLLTKPMSPGFQLPKSARQLLPSSEPSLNDALANLRRAANRFKTEIPDKPHPFLGKLSPDEFIQLQLRHSEMHLGFIIPDDPAK